MTQPHPYDSRPDTYAHIAEVRRLMLLATGDLTRRAHVHDQSKLESPEVEVFDRVTPRLKEVTYGSDEYKPSLAEMGEGLKHHYEHNDHHPEHHSHGIISMNLMQLLEMVCDWMAASKRHPDGDPIRSIDQNATRFKYGPEVIHLLMNTVYALQKMEGKEQDAVLLENYRAAQKRYDGLAVDDAYYGWAPRPDTLEAKKELERAQAALLGISEKTDF